MSSTHRTDHETEYVRRLDGIVSPAFRTRTIMTVGVGAGSYMVEKLARLCPKRLVNVDFDRVEVGNLPRTVYRFEDAVRNRLKVEALEERLRKINPFVDVVSVPADIVQLDDEALEELVAGVDLLVAGTDSFPAQARINQIALWRRIPAVFVGIHAGAEGGRVLWTLSGESACYRCMAPQRYAAFEAGNAQALDLPAARGSLLDCQFVEMVAAKIAAGILERDEDSALGSFFRSLRGRNEAAIRCSPSYEHGRMLWDALLGDLPEKPKPFAAQLREHLHAMDTVWLEIPRDSDCPVCGRRTY